MSSQAHARFEDAKHDLVVKNFGGMNTQAGRTSIAEGEFAWLENLMPVGFANLRAVPHQGASVATLPASSLSYWKYCNLENVDYLAIFSADGAGRLLNLASFAFTDIGTAGTFTLPVACAQWENNRLLIVDANDYYSFDGTLLLRNGSVESITVTAPGTYTSIPTISFSGGGGFGAAAFAAMSLDGAQAVTIGGAGYAVGDTLTLDGGTSSVVGKLRVDAVAAGVITAVSVYQAGSYTVLPASPNAVTGGSGTGATITTSWGVDTITVTDGGTTTYTSSPTVGFSSGAATADATLLAGPAGGQAIATFAGRVWIANGRTVTYSAPDSYVDFTEASAGGSFIVTDETLHSDINALLPANNFLYIFGDSSINVISDVRVVGTPAVTVFSNSNVSPIIGSNLPHSIFPYYRSIGFATPYGFYALNGTTPTKISDQLDGIFDKIDFTQPVSGDIAKILNILCMAFCFSYDDGLMSRTLIAIFFNKKWFLASQGDDLTLVVCGFQAGSPSIFATDGTHIYRLFSDETEAINTSVTTALWPMKHPTRSKQVLKVGVEVSSEIVVELDLAVTSDNLSIPATLQANNVGEWLDASGDVGEWLDGSGTGTWVAGGLQYFQGDGEGYGRYVGYTVASTSPNYTISGFLMQHEERGNWVSSAGGPLNA